MIKRIIWVLCFTTLLASCNLYNNNSQEEMLAKTIDQIVEQELALTPSPLPPTNTSTPTATKPPTLTPTVKITETATQTATADPYDSYPPEGYGPDEFPATINPLTGLQVEDVKVLDRRPISVKVSNFPRGIRPQWGLSLADHVFEYYHEAGSTRFNAIFLSNDVEQIGPIRSGRFPDKDIIYMYKAFFAFGSADYRVRQVLFSSGFSERLSSASDYPCPPTSVYPLCRIEQDTWNHLVTSTKTFYEHFENDGVSNQRQELNGLFFNPQLPPTENPASNIFIRFSMGSYQKWVYDPLIGKYIRFEDAVLAVQGEEEYIQSSDRLNGEPITADNLVILLANHSYYSVDPEIIQIDLFGSAQAYVFREGHAYLVNWHRSKFSDNLSFSYQDGSPFPMKPGNIWFMVVGTRSDIQENIPDWSFQFRIP